MLVALQAYAHRSIRNVASIAGEIVHDRLLLDHRPEPDLLDHCAADDALDGLLLGACRARSQNCGPADETSDKQQSQTTNRKIHVFSLSVRMSATDQPASPAYISLFRPCCVPTQSSSRSTRRSSSR